MQSPLTRNAVILIAILLICASPALADLARGRGAYLRKDYQMAMQEFRPLADKGNPAAQIAVGWLYDNGLGVTHDDMEAAKWYLLAAEQGCAVAQQYLGLMHARGEGLPRDLDTAAAWLRRGAKQGDAGSQYNLGVMYRDGEGVGIDPVTAMKWFTLAASGKGDDPYIAQAKRARSELTLKLTPAQISQALKAVAAQERPRRSSIRRQERCMFARSSR